MSERRFDAVLFDWDDTLCYADPHRFQYAQEIARQFGAEHTLADIRRAFVRADGYSPGYSHEIVQRLPRELGIPDDQHDAFFEAYIARDERKQYRLFDDVLDVMERLASQNLRVGLLSNNVKVMTHVANLAVEDHFEIVISPETYGVWKPEPEIFLETLSVMEVPPARAIYVGDSYEDDVVGARAAGLTPVLIDRFQLLMDRLDVEHRIESLDALEHLLERLVFPRQESGAGSSQSE